MNDLRERLEELAEDNYREFSKKLTPTKYPILGVRTPKLREFAKSVPVGEIENYLRLKPKTFEDVLLRGFLIGRLPYKEMLEWFDSQVEYIDNWATCDMFCSALRPAIKKQLPEFLDLKVKKLLEDKHEFTIRVGLVLLKAYYVETNNLAWIFEEVEKLASREEYYIRMAIAWLISECFIKYPAATTGYLVSSSLPKWTFNKTISKICDSYRVDEETKLILKRMRK
ncbi:DNA alkylation repair protein [Candidatus Saccharibacteria bacterium]|nr:DNA alkylation repair protein [Candidatus Saccharibacteria bacterium]